MTKALFGQRGMGTMNVASTVPGPVGSPRTGKTEGGLATLIVLLVCGTTGLAGLDLHRFWLGHVRAGFVFLGLIGALAANALLDRFGSVKVRSAPLPVTETGLSVSGKRTSRASSRRGCAGSEAR